MNKRNRCRQHKTEPRSGGKPVHRPFHPAGAKPRISVCLIVKNEQTFIDQCLRSVRPVADEIIVVDTGSTDATVEIARRYTDKIYVHPWKDSFSEARNHYLDYATGDWIFQIDADEELFAEDVPKVLDAVRDPDIDGIMVQIVSKFFEGRSEGLHTVERIFRRNGRIRYEGRVHNRIVGMENAKVYPIRLIHYGYDLNRSQARRKFDRTVTLLKMDLAEDPDNPMTHHYLGCSYLSLDMHGEALEESLAAIRLADARGDRSLVFLWSHYNAATAYFKLGHVDRAEETALSALRRFPRHIDSHFILILTAFERQKWEALIEHGQQYMDLAKLLRTRPEEFGNLLTSSLSDEWNIHILMGIARYELGQAEAALASFERAAGCAPERYMGFRAAGIYLKEKGRLELAAAFLRRARGEKPDDALTARHLRELETETGAGAAGPTITCCMIVKNEEAFLDPCLRSVKDWVDEIVVVDTGSTDTTMEIARRYTDRVYVHPWEGSFSKARNQSLSYATGDWIFQIDADEKLVDGCGPMLRQAVCEAGEADAILVNIISTYSKGTRTARHNFERLFRRNGVIHYEGIVHNRVVGFQSAKPSRVELMHYGYDVEEKTANEKFLRTSGLLKEQIRENPSDPMPHHYLGVSYLSRGMNREAAEESIRAIELATQAGEDRHHLYIWAHHNASMALLRSGNSSLAKHYCEEALRRCPEHLDSFFTLAVIAAEEGSWSDVLSSGRSYLERLRALEEHPDRAGYVINCTLKDGATVHLLVGHAYYSLGTIEKMESHYRQASERSANEWESWWNAGAFHLDRSGNFGVAERCLMQALEKAPQESSIWYLLAKLNHLTGRGTDERKYLLLLYSAGNRDLVVLNRLAILHLDAQEPALALKVAEEALALEPTNYTALCSGGHANSRLGRAQSAVEWFMKAVKAHPEGRDAWQHLGESSLDLGQLDASEIFFERALALEPSSKETQLRLCEVELRRHRFEALLRRCDRLMRDLVLDNQRVIRSMEDVAAVLLDIGFAVRHDANLSRLLCSLLRLIPADFNVLRQTYGESAGISCNPEQSDFVIRTLSRLQAPAASCR